MLVTLQRHAKARGYFSPERFTGRIEDAAAHELAMNPDSFTGHTDESILSTLAHEMAHVWQQSHGTPPRRSYHDRQWAAKMKEIGAAVHDRRTRRQGNRPERYALHHHRRRLRESLREAQGPRLSASLEIRTGRKTGEGEEGQQDEVHLPGVRTERIGKAGHAAHLRRMSRGRRRRYMPHADRIEMSNQR